MREGERGERGGSGFPLTSNQLISLQNWYELFAPDYFLELRISEEDLLYRTKNRLADPVTGTIYSSQQVSTTVLLKYTFVEFSSTFWSTLVSSFFCRLKRF